MKTSLYGFLLACLFASACNFKNSKEEENQGQVMGTFKEFDPDLQKIILPAALTEIIADSLDWSEGPLWVESEQMLLFSDVPANKIYKWTEAKGFQNYLDSAGFTGIDPSPFREPGSNGLQLDSNGNLIICQHGDRRISRMDAPIKKPARKFITLADRYAGKKFTSPNDCAISRTGEFFFTDPPYGLKEMDNDSLKEMPWNGVYKIKKNGEVVLLTDSITKPNGIALFPDEKKLLVACSDPEKPNWYVWDIIGDSLANGRIFATAAPFNANWQGLPDGLKIDKNGNVIATGPGGIYFFNSEGKKLGIFRLDLPASNVALSADEKTLFITNDRYVLRVKMRK